MKLRKLNVCYFGSYDLSEPHNHVIIKGLRKNGIKVFECNAPVHKFSKDNKNHYSDLKSFAFFIFSFFLNYARLFKKYFKIKKTDAIIVGYPGYTDILLAKIISFFSGIPLLFNLHISLYDTLVIDRKYVKNKWVARFLHFYDKFICGLPGIILIDTKSHKKFLCQEFNVKKNKIKPIFIGADETIFYPRSQKANKKITVLFYGRFIPLQGIEYIIKAAKLLENNKKIKFKVIGRGQTKNKILQLAKKLKLKNIEFIDWVLFEKLPEEIAKADICLGGQFGTSPKANRVIGYKAFQMMAMKKPIILSNSGGNRELFTHTKNCYMCKIGDAQSIADAILALKNNPRLREKIGKNAYKLFQEKCTSKIIGKQVVKIIKEKVGSRFPGK